MCALLELLHPKPQTLNCATNQSRKDFAQPAMQRPETTTFTVEGLWFRVRQFWGQGVEVSSGFQVWGLRTLEHEAELGALNPKP